VRAFCGADRSRRRGGGRLRSLSRT
jgi:hypothetical protein